VLLLLILQDADAYASEPLFISANAIISAWEGPFNGLDLDEIGDWVVLSRFILQSEI
jgi:hypothetical protein